MKARRAGAAAGLCLLLIQLRTPALPPRSVSPLVIRELAVMPVVRRSRSKPFDSGSTPLLFSGEDDGYLEPCGCSFPQTGGLPRRATVLQRTPRAIFLDNGDWTSEPGRQSELKSEATARFLAKYHYTAVNPGEQEYALGPGALFSAAHTGVPLLSTNVTVNGAPLFRPEITVSRNGRRIVIFGALSPTFADTVTQANPGMKIEDPSAALQTHRPEGSAGVSLLLYHGPSTEAMEIARKCPWLSLIVTAHSGDDPQPPLRIGKVLILHPGVRARFLGRAVIRWQRTPIVVPLQPLSLGPQFPDALAARQILKEYVQQVSAEDLLAAVPRAPLEGNWYAGSAACAPCHLRAYRTWASSRHTRAYNDLMHVGHGRDPDCVGCHVIGLQSVGGFVSFDRTPLLAEVGCETCHGPQGLHGIGRGPAPEKLSKEMCVTCHNPEQSPHFNLGAYWRQIAH